MSWCLLFGYFFGRAVEVIDDLKSRLNDPCITCHWSTVGSDTNTSATVHITSPEVGHLARYVIGVLIITLACRECHLILRLSYQVRGMPRLRGKWFLSAAPRPKPQATSPFVFSALFLNGIKARTKHDHQNQLWAILSLSDCARLRKNSYKNSDFDHAAWNVFLQVVISVTRGSTRNSCSECWWSKCWPSHPPSGFRRLHLKSGWLENSLVTVTSWIKYIVVLLIVELNCNVFKFLFLQVCNHRLLVAKSLAQSLGWHVIHCSRHVGTGAKERQGHVGGLMVKSPNGNK